MEKVLKGPFKITTGLDDIDVSLSLVNELLESGLVSRKSKIVEITEQYIVVDEDLTTDINDYVVSKGYSVDSVDNSYVFSDKDKDKDNEDETDTEGVTNEVKTLAGLAPMLGNNIEVPAIDPTNTSGEHLENKEDYKDGAMVEPIPALAVDIEDNAPNTESILEGVVNQPIVLKRKLYRKIASKRKSYSLEAYDITTLDGENTKETMADVFEYAADILKCSVGDVARIIPSFDYGKDREDILEDPTAWGGFDYQYFDNLKITSKQIIAKDIELDREHVKVGLYKMEGTPVVLFSFYGGSCVAIAKKNSFRKLGDHEDSLEKIMSFSNTNNRVNKYNKMRIKRKLRKNYAKDDTLAVVREDSMVDWELSDEDEVINQFFVVCDYICDLLGIDHTSSDSMDDELITVRLASNQNKVSTLRGDIEFGKQYDHYKDNFNFKVIKHNKVNFPRLIKEAPSRINYEYADYVTVNGISMVLMGYKEKGVKLVDAYMSGNDDSSNLVMLEWFDEEDYINGTYEYSQKRKVKKQYASRREQPVETGRPLAVSPELYLCDWDGGDDDELTDRFLALEEFIRFKLGAKPWEQDQYNDPFLFVLPSYQNKVSKIKERWDFGTEYSHFEDNFEFKLIKHDTKVDHYRLLYGETYKVKYDFADNVEVNGVPLLLLGYKFRGKKLVDAFLMKDFAEWNVDMVDEFPTGELMYYTDKTPPRDLPSRFESEGRKPYSNSYNRHKRRYSLMKKRRAYARRRANFALDVYDVTGYYRDDDEYGIEGLIEFAAGELKCDASNVIAIVPDFRYVDRPEGEDINLDVWGAKATDYNEDLFDISPKRNISGYDHLESVTRVQSMVVEGSKVIMFHMTDNTVVVLANRKDYKLYVHGDMISYEASLLDAEKKRRASHAARTNKSYSLNKRLAKKLNREIVRRLYNDNRFKKRVALEFALNLKNK